MFVLAAITLSSNSVVGGITIREPKLIIILHVDGHLFFGESEYTQQITN